MKLVRTLIRYVWAILPVFLVTSYLWYVNVYNTSQARMERGLNHDAQRLKDGLEKHFEPERYKREHEQHPGTMKVIEEAWGLYLHQLKIDIARTPPKSGS